MDYIYQGIWKALELILAGDREVFHTALLSLRISSVAILFASLVGIPLGFIIATNDFLGKRALITVFNTLMALPTVVVGLLVYSLISRQGPLSPLGLLFTPGAMIIGQVILASPIVVSLTISAIQAVDPKVRLTALTLGANSWQTAWSIFSEARFPLMAAVIAGFGRVIAEVGCALIVGGNIRGYTRTMTTAIALEVGKGEFSFALALGFILLTLAFSINLCFHYLQAKKT